jgi:hypothetical protein
VARAYKRSEIQGLIEALERQCREAAKLAKIAQNEATRHSFVAYRQFRDKVGEFKALCILVEGRLRTSEGSGVADLQERYETVDIGMLSLLIKASMRFFFVLSANPILPLGAKDIFTSELRSLYEARERLSSPRYVQHLDDTLKMELETAGAILEEIIEKAPTMLQFGTTEAA